MCSIQLCTHAVLCSLFDAIKTKSSSILSTANCSLKWPEDQFPSIEYGDEDDDDDEEDEFGEAPSSDGIEMSQ